MHTEHRDQIWDKEESNWKFRQQERETFLSLLYDRNDKILEIGPGYGRVMREIKKNGGEITGLEISDNLYRKLLNKGFEVIQGDALQMPFKDNSFSCIAAEEVIEHIKQQEKLLNEVTRVLKPDGYSVFTTPNKWIYRMFMYLSNIINWKWSWPLLLNPTPGHVAELTIKKARKLFSKHFNEVTIIPLNPYLPNKFLKKYPSFAIGQIIIAKK